MISFLQEAAHDEKIDIVRPLEAVEPHLLNDLFRGARDILIRLVTRCRSPIAGQKIAVAFASPRRAPEARRTGRYHFSKGK